MALRIIQITDLHLLEPGQRLMGLDVESRFEAVLAAAEDCAPEAYFFTGDFCAHDPEPSVYRRLRDRFDRLGKPWFVTPGNHDDRRMMRTIFDLPGPDSAAIYSAETIGDRSFLFVDTSAGTLPDQVLDWLEEKLVEHPHADIVMHHPPVKMGVPFMDDNYPLKDTDRLLRMLTGDGNRRRIFTGHYHTVRSVSHANLEVYICPPTSFCIDPLAAEFELVVSAPGFQILEWSATGDFRCAPVWLGNFSES